MAQTGDLTTLPRVIDWLNTSSQSYPPGDNKLLARLITSASRFVVTYMSSQVAPANYVEKRNGSGTSALFMRNRPVVAVSGVSVGGVAVQPSSSPGSTGFLFSDTQVLMPGTVFPMGLLNVSVSYVAGFQASASVTIPTNGSVLKVEDLQGISQVSGVPADLWNCDRGVTLSDGTVLALVTGDPADGQYRVAAQADGSWGYVFNSAQGDAEATLVYGFTPADIEAVVVELVGERFKTRTRIGQTSVTAGNGQTTAFSQKDMNDFMRTTLNQYRSVVPV